MSLFLGVPRGRKGLTPKQGTTEIQYSYTATGTLFLLDNA
jgi:hypothetical protein